MALEKKELDRGFKFGEIVLTDPNPSFTTNQVLDFYSDQYPELVNANITGPTIENDVMVYKFGTSVGKKG
jgi:PRTRC genetic system protein C